MSATVASELLAQETARGTSFPECLAPVLMPAAPRLADWRRGGDATAPEREAARLYQPVMVIHGARVAEASLSGTELWRVPGSDCLDAFDGNPDQDLERAAGHLDARLK